MTGRLRRAVLDRLLGLATARRADVVIGAADSPYLLRWFVIPPNRWCNVYLHQFRRSDDDRALHDHPWLFNASWLLLGSYVEHTPRGARLRQEGAFKLRVGRALHRVALFPCAGAPPGTGRGAERPVWTLFITGPKVREWGFACPNGWRHWRDYTADGGATVGRGCE